MEIRYLCETPIEYNYIEKFFNRSSDRTTEYFPNGGMSVFSDGGFCYNNCIGCGAECFNKYTLIKVSTLMREQKLKNILDESY